MIQVVLLVQHIDHSFFNRLDDYDIAVEVSFCIHIPDNPVYKCPEEVPLAKLYDTLRPGDDRNVLFI